MFVCVCGSVICNINSVPERPKKETQKFSSSLPLNERNEKKKQKFVAFILMRLVGLGGTYVGLMWDLVGLGGS